MLKKLKIKLKAQQPATPNHPIPTDMSLTQDMPALPPLQPPRSPTSYIFGGLPEIRLQGEGPSSAANFAEPQSCMTCEPLTASTEQPVRKRDLLQSAENGCSVCSLIRGCLQIVDIDKVDYVSTWIGREGVFAISLGRDDVDEGTNAAGQGATVMFLASNGERSDSPFPWLPIVTKSPFDRNQLRDTQVLSSWISDCQANHPSCRQIVNPRLPTRVINVGSDTIEPFLKISHGETGRYLALSHRWGTLNTRYKMLITKCSNIEHFCREIPLNSLPLTFRHAIEVCRSIGIQYLWIDSLCIIQDDMRDWEIEAARMGSIYENAYATLFAERASHCEGGLFQTAEDRSKIENWIQEIEYENPKTNQKNWILVSFDLSYYPNSLEEAFCLVDKPISHLQNRGWIMQEEILSRRKICFSETELHWQCSSISQCECGLRSVADTRFTNDFTRDLLLTRRSDGSVSRGLSSSTSRSVRRSADINKSWKNLIEIYSQRQFTNERDRLTALAGCATKFGGLSNNYLAGIWRQYANDQLLWYGVNWKEIHCGKHEHYYAPSWSWASLRGEISFCSFSIGHLRQHIWNIIDGWCQSSTENPMGPVLNGVLRIQSKVAPVIIEECEGSVPDSDCSKDNIFWNNHAYEKERDGKTYHLMLRTDTGVEKATSIRSQRNVVSLDTYDDWKLFAGKKPQRYYYLIAQIGSTKGAVVISENVASTMGMLIRESTVKQGYWERICLIAPQGWWGDWSKISEDREIILI